MTECQQAKQTIYNYVQSKAQESGVFGEVIIDDRGVKCAADGSAEPAFYRIEIVDGKIWAVLETEDRWLSGSIEGDLAGTGDQLDDLLEEEIADQGHAEAKVGFEHFRSPDMLYTFRSPLNVSLESDEAAELAWIWLKGYEIVFRELGDMDESEED